jgi:hypothetical protein
MATAEFAETLENLQEYTWLIPEIMLCCDISLNDSPNFS